MEVGLNLYSIRDLIATEEGYIDTLKKLKEMGYSYVQFSGSGYDVDKIKRGIKESGLPVVLTHVPQTRILNETDKLIEEHLSFGCKNIGLGGFNQADKMTDDIWKKTIDATNIAAEKMAKAGCKFFCHHHHYEFVKMANGKTIFDYIIENAPYINFTLDTYWLQYAGQNPVTYADKVNGRLECVHLKDYRVNRNIVDNNPEFKPGFAPVGTGSLDMKAIIENYKKNGAKYFLVEQDDATTYPDPLEQVKISVDYLTKI